MKKSILPLILTILFLSNFAAAPQKISYQAVVRTADNNLVTNQKIGLKISILPEAESDKTVYVEEHTATANGNGLVTVEIGAGTSTANFSDIDWSNGPFFIKTEIDPLGGTVYSITSTSQLLSVPYALHAETATSFAGTLPETDPEFSSSLASKLTAEDTIRWNKVRLIDSIVNLQTPKLIDTIFVFNVDTVHSIVSKTDTVREIVSQKDTVYSYHTDTVHHFQFDNAFQESAASGITEANIASWNEKLDTELDADPTNELQILTISNDTIYLSNGGFAKLPTVETFSGDYEDLANAPNLKEYATSDALDFHVERIYKKISDVKASAGGPTALSQLTNDVGFISEDTTLTEEEVDAMVANNGFLTEFTETDPAFAAWGKNYDDLANKPDLTSFVTADDLATIEPNATHSGDVTGSTELTITEGAVTSDKILDGTITGADLALNSIGLTAMAANSVNSSKVQDNSLTAADLAANSVGASEIAAGAVRSQEVLDNSLTEADLAANSVTVSEIAAGAVITQKLATDAVVSTKIKDGTIEKADLATGVLALGTVLAENNDAGAKKITNLADPTDAQDAATKAYVDALEAQLLELQIATGIKIQDIDGNVYSTVTINGVVWMKENLKTTTLNNGTEILHITSEMVWDMSSGGTSAFCWYANDRSENESFGILYNKKVVASGNLCPAGWHVSTREEWDALIAFYGGATVAGEALKETGSTHWHPNNQGTNESGFTALGGGHRDGNGSFYNRKYYGYYAAIAGTLVNSFELSSSDGSVSRTPTANGYAQSVRCVKD